MIVVELEHARAWSAEVGREGIAVRVAAGEVWITREGDPEDHVVAAPRTFESDRPGRLAVQALGPARLEVRPLRGAGALHPERAALPAPR